ncbi:hypothetical protein [Piscinibacter koreensis]|uniref:Uncharacterized protein n=1 Tax=Piscinibacter koreensis TaxID=2742824 RepID=A0A7Y6NJS4_9BURK|nr:hypothetical protein [Schlegelella koreensis]NUZ04471.1 hypothetical protein [Schlegelella koreensis]
MATNEIDGTAAEGDEARDAFLAAALRHAPDAEVAAPPGISDAILREARSAAAGAARPAASPAQHRAGRAAAPAPRRGVAGLWDWLGRPAVASGFASVIGATLIGVMWWGRPIDPNPPRPDPPPVSIARDESGPREVAPAPAPVGPQEAAPRTPLGAERQGAAPGRMPPPGAAREARAARDGGSKAEVARQPGASARPARPDAAAPRAAPEPATSAQGSAATAAAPAPADPVRVPEPAAPPTPPRSTATNAAPSSGSIPGGVDEQRGDSAFAKREFRIDPESTARDRAATGARAAAAAAAAASRSELRRADGSARDPAREQTERRLAPAPHAAAPAAAMPHPSTPAPPAPLVEPAAPPADASVGAAPAATPGAPRRSAISGIRTAPLQARVAGAPQRWSWRSGNGPARPMTPAVIDWIGRFERAAVEWPTDVPAGAGAAARTASSPRLAIELMLDGRLQATLSLGEEAGSIDLGTPATQRRGPLASDVAADLRRTAPGSAPAAAPDGAVTSDGVRAPAPAPTSGPASAPGASDAAR